MSIDNALEYSIGDVAAVMGITPGALHYYEREGLLRPKRRKSGHRYFDIADVWRLFSYEKYHAMGYPIKSVMSQFSCEGGSVVDIKERIEHQMNEARRSSLFYASVADAIEEYMRGIQNIDTLLSAYRFDNANEMLLYTDDADPYGGWISDDPKKQSATVEWLKAMPASRMAIAYLGDPNAAFDADAGHFGFVVSPAQSELFGITDTSKCKSLPRSMCMHTIVAMEHDFIYRPGTAFEGLLANAKGRGFTVSGIPWGVILMVEQLEEDPSEGYGKKRAFVELWAPIG